MNKRVGGSLRMFLYQEESCVNKNVGRWLCDGIIMPFVNDHVHKSIFVVMLELFSSIKVFVSYNKCSTMQHFFLSF